MTELPSSQQFLLPSLALLSANCYEASEFVIRFNLLKRNIFLAKTSGRIFQRPLWTGVINFRYEETQWFFVVF